jgi:S-DNA-T family DNA segregation ATPase FtsK/SpoIIIE
MRLVGSVTSPEDAKVASGLAGTGAEKLQGQGDFLIVSHGQITRFQAAFIEADEIKRLVQAICAGQLQALLAAPGSQENGG